jgi:hypothetical protein
MEIIAIWFVAMLTSLVRASRVEDLLYRSMDVCEVEGDLARCHSACHPVLPVFIREIELLGLLADFRCLARFPVLQVVFPEKWGNNK